MAQLEQKQTDGQTKINFIKLQIDKQKRIPVVVYLEGDKIKKKSVYQYWDNAEFLQWTKDKYQWHDFQAGVYEICTIDKKLDENGIPIRLTLKWKDKTFQRSDICLKLNGSIYGIDANDLHLQLVDALKDNEGCKTMNEV